MTQRMILLFLLILAVPIYADMPNIAAIKVKPNSDSVALTFDDGPSPIYTPQILDVLKKYNIKATFFVLGKFAEKYPDLIKRIHEEGHVVANHTYDHFMLTRLPQKKMESEIVRTNEIVEKIIGKKPKCLRPPYGKHNKNVDKFANSIGLAVVTWDWNSFDYNRPGTKKLAQWVLKHTKPGYDILMHDGSGNRSQTVAALPIIIEGLRARGLKFDTICD